MKIHFLWVLPAVLLFTACASNGKGTLASLDKTNINLKEQNVDGSLDKAMQSYEQFLKQSPETAMTPEAMRRLADLKIEKEYGTITDKENPAGTQNEDPQKFSTGADKKIADPIADTPPPQHIKNLSAVHGESKRENDQQFEARTTRQTKLTGDNATVLSPEGESVDLQTAGAKQAVQIYRKLLQKYPYYQRNDQVLYQLSRAYEEMGKVDEAMSVLNQLVKKYPRSKHIDETQFRRAEYYFTRKKYLDAQYAYKAVLDYGNTSDFYELSLYKQGWAFFKQDLYEQALDDFIGLIDYKVANGYDFTQTVNKTDNKRMEDNFRVISLSFSYLGGPQAIVDFFDKKGARDYDDAIYSHLGEHYLVKRRYADAAEAYQTYVKRKPYTKVAPHFHKRIIEIFAKGGFPKLVVEAKKQYAEIYRLSNTYWTYFDIRQFPDILAFIKTNLHDLANHYHALYQNPRFKKQQQANFEEATHWYRVFLESFPQDGKAPKINFQLAALLLQHKDYRNAALQYERTSYDYPAHDKSADAGFSAVVAYREFLKVAPPAQSGAIKRDIIRSSLKFAEFYPKHKKAILVMVAAIDDLFILKDYANAVEAGRKMLTMFAQAPPPMRRPVWQVIAHSSFEMAQYHEAEIAYIETLKLIANDHKSRPELVENLAASIYKQGEQARKLEQHQQAAEHFLRVSKLAPTAKLRPVAEYDGAASLILLKNWTRATAVLLDFRKRFPGHELQPAVTQKLAIVYKEDGKTLFAASEFEQIEKENKDPELRREALLQAAQLYMLAKRTDNALMVYLRYVDIFTSPIETHIEIRHKIAELYRQKHEQSRYLAQLTIIVDMDEHAGGERSDRTKFLAAHAGLVLIEKLVERYQKIKLIKPFRRNLKKKQQHMKKVITALNKLLNYGVGEVTAAATFQLAEMYFDFSQSLMQSQRPDNLNALELEQYNLVLEEQAYPFEEKAIRIHEKNMELLDIGVYNSWIEKSLAKLAKLMPARYAKSESPSKFAASITGS